MHRSFHGQSILIISPQSWDHLAISKHHYALELAARGNRVCFLEPDEERRDRPRLSARKLARGLTAIRIRSLIPVQLRFHARPLYDRAIRLDIARIRQAIGEPLDVVWSFDPARFADLRLFGAPFAIYHSVDLADNVLQRRPASSANLVLAVSRSILGSFDGVKTPCRIVNHGLSSDFVRLAGRRVAPADVRRARLRVGYVGNLLHPALDRRALGSIIERHPEVEFHLWGTREIEPYMLPVADEVPEFVARLESSANVVLHGPVATSQLAEEIAGMDAFVLAYRNRDRLYDCSNSHKILEYLSTGRVVVSTPVSEYAGHPELLQMASSNSAFSELFDAVIADLDDHNAPRKQECRRAFALDHSYARQIDRIGEFVSALQGRSIELGDSLPLAPVAASTDRFAGDAAVNPM